MLKKIAALVLLATPANSLELGVFLQSIDGTEVSSRATIGFERGANMYIGVEGMASSIPAQAALDREKLASLEGCSFRNLNDLCTADIQAELQFSDGRIFAIVFDVQNVVRGD
jgi:hypothetical protein